MSNKNNTDEVFVGDARIALAASSSQIPALKLALEEIGTLASETSPIVSTYYDSPDFRLFEKGLCLSVQHQSSNWVQVLKAVGPVSGWGFLRDNWQDLIATDQPDANAPETGPLLRMVVDNELHPLFKTQVTPTIFRVSMDPGVEIAAMIREGEIYGADGEVAESLLEVELALKRGEPAALYDLALRLVDVVPLRIELEGEAPRGYRLSGASLKRNTGKPFYHGQPVTVEALLQKAAYECLGELLSNERAALAGEPAAFHQMRVALRRLRSVLSTVKAMLPPEHYRSVQADLKWMAGSLGPARDWDVMMADLITPIQSILPGDADLKKLVAAAKRQRRVACEMARSAIESHRYTGTLLKLARWFALRGWRDQPASENSAPLFAPVSAVAPALIERRWRQVRKRSKGFAKLTQEERHDFRIALKKLRYMIEVGGGAFDAREVKTLIKRVKPLQEKLGHINDIRIAQRLIKHVAYSGGDGAGELSQDAGLVLGWHIRGMAEEEAKLQRNVRRLRKARPFWRDIKEWPAAGVVAEVGNRTPQGPA
jgi:triphosphatase